MYREIWIIVAGTLEQNKQIIFCICNCNRKFIYYDSVCLANRSSPGLWPSFSDQSDFVWASTQFLWPIGIRLTSTQFLWPIGFHIGFPTDDRLAAVSPNANIDCCRQALDSRWITLGKMAEFKHRLTIKLTLETVKGCHSRAEISGHRIRINCNMTNKWIEIWRPAFHMK